MNVKQTKTGQYKIYSNSGKALINYSIKEQADAERVMNEFFREDETGVYASCFRQSSNRGSNTGSSPSVYWRKLKA